MGTYRHLISALRLVCFTGIAVTLSTATAAPLLGPNPSWTKKSVGQRVVMVILMDYDDVRFARTTTQTKKHFEDWFFSQTKFPSLHRFFEENSYGRLDVRTSGEMMVVRAVDDKTTAADESSFQCMDAWQPVSKGEKLPVPHFKQWIIQPVIRGQTFRLRSAHQKKWVLQVKKFYALGDSPQLGLVGDGGLSTQWRKVPTKKGRFKLQNAWAKKLFLGAEGDLIVLSNEGTEWTQVKLPSGKFGLMRTDSDGRRPFKFLGVSPDRKQTITSHGNRGCGGLEVHPGGGGGVENLVRLYHAIRLAQSPKPPPNAAGYSKKSADFRRFDKNKDGVITDDELLVFVIAPNAHRLTTGGAARWVRVKGLSDAKGTFEIALSVGAFSDLIDFNTFGHEAAHLFGALDLYGPGGSMNHTMTLMGAQAHKGIAGQHTLHLDPYHKIRFGWVEPRLFTSGTFDCATLQTPNNPGRAATTLQRPLVIRDPDPQLADAGSFLFEYRAGHGKRNYDKAFFAEGRCVEGNKYKGCRVASLNKELEDECRKGSPPCPYWIDTRFKGIFRSAKKSKAGYVCEEGTRFGQSNCKVKSLPKLKTPCYPGSKTCFYYIDTKYNGVFTIGQAVGKTRDGVVSWWVGRTANACDGSGCKQSTIATYIEAGSSGNLLTTKISGDDKKKGSRVEPGPNKMLETKKHPQDEYRFKQYDVSTVGKRHGVLSFGAKSVWTYDDGLVRLPVRTPADQGKIGKIVLSNWWFRVGKRQKGGRIDIAWGIDKSKLEKWKGKCPTAKTRDLKLYVSPKRRDAFTAATQAGYAAAKSAKYAQWGGVQGRIFATQQAGTVPLKLYWSAERKDNFSTATAWGEAAAKWAGYTFVRIQGYVYPNTDSRPNTIPLRSFWGQKVGWLDNWTTTDRAVIDVLKGWGWLDTGVQAYILKPKAGHRGRAKGPKANLIAQAKKAKGQSIKQKRDFAKYLKKAKANKTSSKAKTLSRGLKKDCRKALRTVCKKAGQSATSTRRCLKQNFKKLSRACQKRITTKKTAPKAANKKQRERFKKYCRPELKSLCKRAKSSHHLQCLLRHESKLSRSCRTQVRKARRADKNRK